MSRGLAMLALLVAAAGCRQDMHDQPKYKPLRESAFFADGRASRPLVPGTVARGHLYDDTAMVTGKRGDAWLADPPMPMTAALLGRGHERFDIYCSVCHDRVGTGQGMIVRRGFKRPPSFHIDRLRNVQAGYVFDVVSRGFGAMPGYAAQIPVEDRWAIVAYLRALQRSQWATLGDVPAGERAALEGGR